MDGRAGICEDLVPCTAMLSDGNKQSKYLKLNNEGSVEIEEAKVFGVCLVAGMIQLFMIDSLSHRASRHPAAPTTARHIPCGTTPPEMPQREHRGKRDTAGSWPPGNTVSHVTSARGRVLPAQRGSAVW